MVQNDLVNGTLQDVYLVDSVLVKFKGWEGYKSSFLFQGASFNLYGSEDLKSFLAKDGAPVKGLLKLSLVVANGKLKPKFSAFVKHG